MAKKIIVIVLAAILISVAWKLNVKAQKSQEETNPMEVLARLESSVARLQGNLDSSDKETAAKLNEILDNQEKILKQLDIIRIRATR
ncbi:MAG: hypothetical protein PHN57_08895 [Candidatus Omnitrophica bacterium]|nr:hypothetical protein [Candidatus Omnitrophota bacterium]